MIACTDTQGFEEGENCASTISVEHTLGSDMDFIRSDMILFWSDLILLGSRVQDISVLLVVVLINFGVKKQVPKISFKIFVGDLMSVLSHEFDYIIFYKYFNILEIILYFRIYSNTHWSWASNKFLQDCMH